MPPNLCKPTLMGGTPLSRVFGVRSAGGEANYGKATAIQLICVLVALLVIVGFQYRERSRLALESWYFNVEDDVGMLKGDPGLLYYLTERVIDAGGGVPDDWTADPRIEYPDVVNIPATYTVGQEFLVAWCWKWFGGDGPLHVFITHLMAVVASLSAFGVYLLGAELARSRTMGLFAAALSSTLPANFRTIGLVLVREDLSLPFLALHLGLLACRRRCEHLPNPLIGVSAPIGRRRSNRSRRHRPSPSRRFRTGRPPNDFSTVRADPEMSFVQITWPRRIRIV